MEVFIIDGVRTAIGKYGGALSAVRADDLAAHCIQALTQRNTQIPLERIEEVVLGCANQAGEDNRNVARISALLAGLPASVAGITLNRLCASGMSAVIAARQALALSEGEVIIAGGVEQMTRAPFVIAKQEKAFSRQAEIYDSTMGWRFINPRFKELWGTEAMGETAENLAVKYGITRVEQDQFAQWSQEKVAAARQRNRFAEEIISVPTGATNGGEERQLFCCDEFPRPETSLAALAGLKPAFKKNGTVTAGNSSGINDGAAALLLASEVGVKNYSLQPIARILGAAVEGVEPSEMGIGPVPASKKVLHRLGLSLKDIDVIELNEAFAAQCLACLKLLGLKFNDPRVNPNGGAIALGHPLGMSGARLVLTAARELKAQGGRYALCTMCVGVGQGCAVVIENIEN